MICKQVNKELICRALFCFLAIFFMGVSFVACHKGNMQYKARIVVGSKNDIESQILAKIIIHKLKRNNYDIIDYSNSGHSEKLRNLILQESIDIYTEDFDQLLQIYGSRTIKDMDRENYYKNLEKRNYNLVWLSRANFSKITGIAVKENIATKYNLKNLSSLSVYLKNGGNFKFVCSQYFYDSYYGLKYIEEKYKFHLKRSQVMIINNADTSVSEFAVIEGVNGALGAMSTSTDGMLAYKDIIFLNDDLDLLLKSSPYLVIRKKILENNPEIEKILREIFIKIDEKTMQGLNAEVEVSEKRIDDVAENFIDRISTQKN